MISVIYCSELCSRYWLFYYLLFQFIM